MSNLLFETRVRRNWAELTYQADIRRARLWTVMQLAVVTAVITLLVLQLLLPRWPWHGWLRMALLSTLFWLFPLSTIYGTDKLRHISFARLLVSLIALAVTYFVAYATYPKVTAGPDLTQLPSAAMVLVPILTWTLLLWARRDFPTKIRRLGFTRERWIFNLLIGATAGGVLILHLLVSTGLHQSSDVGLNTLLWLFLWQVGVGAPGEELYFRGLGFQVQSDQTDRVDSRLWLRPALLNTVTYLVPIAAIRNPALILWIFVYGAMFALVASYLRYRQDSLLPGLACNVVFATTLAVLTGI